MNKKAKRDLLPILIAFVALILAGFAWQRGGFELIWAGLRSGLSLLLKNTPLLIAAFLTAGLIQALVKREMVEQWLGSESGWRGMLLACIGGALIPGGPYAYYPIAGALLQTGAGLGVLVAFVTAKNLWSISRLPMEFALLGPRLTLIRFAITFVFPPVLAITAQALFGSQIEQIRAAVTQSTKEPR